MKENSMRIKSKDRVFSRGKVETFTRGITLRISDRATVKCTLKMVPCIGDNGRMEIRREKVYWSHQMDESKKVFFKRTS